MARLVAENSGGRLQIRIFHSRQLGEERETIEQTRVGAIDLNRTNVALIGNFVPAVNVLAMPFLFRSAAHLHKVLDGPIGGEILDSFEPYGFVGLAFYDSGARSIYNGVRPVRSVADLRGLRLRVQQSALMSDMVRALGAEPVELPYGQVLTGLATRLVDGAENNWPSFVTTDHYKYAGYYTLTEHTMSPEVLVMSQKAWQSLSTEDRDIFRDAAMRSSRFMREQWAALEEQSRRQAEAAGGDDRDRFRPQAVRGRDGPDLRENAARSSGCGPDRTHPHGGVSRFGSPPAGPHGGRPGELRSAGPFRHRRAAARGADPLAHPVDRGAELGGRGGAGHHDLERRPGARLGLGRRAAGAGIRQDPGGAGERDQPAAEPDPPLHQPAEPRTVRRNPAAARSRARHPDHARLDRSDAVGIGGGTRTRHRSLPQRLRRVARGAGDHLEDLRAGGS